MPVTLCADFCQPTFPLGALCLNEFQHGLIRAPPNKPMQTTANSIALVRKACRWRSCGRGG
jgi:hypothetical protein